MAVDIDFAKCDRAVELGADAAMTPDEMTALSDVVLDFVGTTASLALAARVALRGFVFALYNADTPGFSWRVRQ
jgi:hypothetical protein